MWNLNAEIELLRITQKFKPLADCFHFGLSKRAPFPFSRKCLVDVYSNKNFFFEDIFVQKNIIQALTSFNINVWYGMLSQSIVPSITKKSYFLLVGFGTATIYRPLNTKVQSRKFCIRKNRNKIVSIETGRIVTAHLLPSSKLENIACERRFSN